MVISSWGDKKGPAVSSLGSGVPQGGGMCPRPLPAGSVRASQGHWYHAKVLPLPFPSLLFPFLVYCLPLASRRAPLSSDGSFSGNFGLILQISRTHFES